MSDVNGTAKTTKMWQDNHSGLRRHKLMTKELGETIPALRSTANIENSDDVTARAKLFCPYNGWTWYVTEWNAETGECFGLVEGFETELGYFDLTELSEVTVLGGVPAVSVTSTGSDDPGRDQEEVESRSVGCGPHTQRSRRTRTYT